MQNLRYTQTTIILKAQFLVLDREKELSWSCHGQLMANLNVDKIERKSSAMKVKEWNQY